MNPLVVAVRCKIRKGRTVSGQMDIWVDTTKAPRTLYKKHLAVERRKDFTCLNYRSASTLPTPDSRPFGQIRHRSYLTNNTRSLSIILKIWVISLARRHISGPFQDFLYHDWIRMVRLCFGTAPKVNPRLGGLILQYLRGLLKIWG